MNKSQFQNQRPDLGLNASERAVLKGGHPGSSATGNFGFNAFGGWMGHQPPVSWFPGARARMTSYEQLVVTGFGELIFEVTEEL